MIHVYDQDFAQKVAETFHEAYMTHTSTSPNYQILASLDLGRRQAALEGFELVQKQLEYAMRLRDAIDHHPLLSKYMRCLTTADLIPARLPAVRHRPAAALPGWTNMVKAWEQRRVRSRSVPGDPLHRRRPASTATRSSAHDLMDKFGIQINKTSRNTVLFMTNIGTTRSSVAYLIEVLVSIARDLDNQAAEMSPAERAAFERAVMHLTNPVAPLPHFSGFHPAFLSQSDPPTPEGDVRRAFFLSYDHTMCEYLPADDIEEKMENGESVVSATFVTPYPPGFPVLVPGQVFSNEILSFMRSLDTPEIHGYQPELGYRVYTSKALEIVSQKSDS